MRAVRSAASSSTIGAVAGGAVIGVAAATSGHWLVGHPDWQKALLATPVGLGVAFLARRLGGGARDADQPSSAPVRDASGEVDR